MQASDALSLLLKTSKNMSLLRSVKSNSSISQLCNSHNLRKVLLHRASSLSPRGASWDYLSISRGRLRMRNSTNRKCRRVKTARMISMLSAALSTAKVKLTKQSRELTRLQAKASSRVSALKKISMFILTIGDMNCSRISLARRKRKSMLTSKTIISKLPLLMSRFQCLSPSLMRRKSLHNRRLSYLRTSPWRCQRSNQLHQVLIQTQTERKTSWAKLKDSVVSSQPSAMSWTMRRASKTYHSTSLTGKIKTWDISTDLTFSRVWTHVSRYPFNQWASRKTIRKSVWTLMTSLRIAGSSPYVRESSVSLST